MYLFLHCTELEYPVSVSGHVIWYILPNVYPHVFLSCQKSAGRNHKICKLKVYTCLFLSAQFIQVLYMHSFHFVRLESLVVHNSTAGNVWINVVSSFLVQKQTLPCYWYCDNLRHMYPETSPVSHNTLWKADDIGRHNDLGGPPPPRTGDVTIPATELPSDIYKQLISKHVVPRQSNESDSYCHIKC